MYVALWPTKLICTYLAFTEKGAHFPTWQNFNKNRSFFPNDIHAIFYKNKLYKNTEAQIWTKIKNKLRTSPTWNSQMFCFVNWSNLDRTPDIEMVKFLCTRLTGKIVRWQKLLGLKPYTVWNSLSFEPIKNRIKNIWAWNRPKI